MARAANATERTRNEVSDQLESEGELVLSLLVDLLLSMRKYDTSKQARRALYPDPGPADMRAVCHHSPCFRRTLLQWLGMLVSLLPARRRGPFSNKNACMRSDGLGPKKRQAVNIGDDRRI